MAKLQNLKSYTFSLVDLYPILNQNQTDKYQRVTSMQEIMLKIISTSYTSIALEISNIEELEKPHMLNKWKKHQVPVQTSTTTQNKMVKAVLYSFPR